MKTTLRSLFTAAVLAATPLAATAQNSEAVAQCMMANSGPEEERMMKDFLIAVLEEASADQVQGIAMNFGFAVIALATEDCGVPFDQVQGIGFMQASERYGELMGMKVMEDAMGRVGLQ